MKFIIIISVGDIGSETDDFFLSHGRDNCNHNGISSIQFFSQIAQQLKILISFKSLNIQPLKNS